MFYKPRMWNFVADMNYDGQISISDIWLWFKWFYFYPGDWIIKFLINNIPSVANFLKISYEDYGGFLSGVVSLVTFFLIISGIWKAFFESKGRTEYDSFDFGGQI